METGSMSIVAFVDNRVEDVLASALLEPSGLLVN
jgi:hypothetical protein